MATKTIQFTLDVSSIAQAIQEVEKYRDDLKQAIQELVRALTEEGREAAVMNVVRLGAFDTGQLADTSFHTRGYYNDDYSIGIIYTDAYYAVFVEYGTGVVGMSEPYSGPFMPVSVTVKGNTYSAYDQNGHGDAGWWYISDRDGKRHWTKGQPSRPFMYNTKEQLQSLCGQIAKEVFGG